jgi:hypothetical protein
MTLTIISWHAKTMVKSIKILETFRRFISSQDLLVLNNLWLEIFLTSVLKINYFATIFY